MQYGRGKVGDARKKTATILYDGSCPRCTRWAKAAQRRDSDIEIQPWQEAELEKLGLEAGECKQAVQYVERYVETETHRNGEATYKLSGAAAVAAVWRRRGKGWAALAKTSQLPAIAEISQTIYGFVAKRRKKDE